ncbi:MAG: hypothetical protein J6O51_03405 [Bacteroidales bacterium]|nr:hypothetical protein [Bacteroidales bacterium]
MSEYTVVYLREKAAPLLSFRDHPTVEELEGKSEEEIQAIYQEIQTYNDTVEETFGCELFYLTTTPSRRLNVLPWSPDPKPLTKGLLEEIINFYNERISSYVRIISERKEDVERYEARIIRANADLYDKIDEDIFDCKRSIEESQEEMDELKFYCSEFRFLQGILDNKSNSERYELIYTKC